MLVQLLGQKKARPPVMPSPKPVEATSAALGRMATMTKPTRGALLPLLPIQSLRCTSKSVAATEPRRPDTAMMKTWTMTTCLALRRRWVQRGPCA